MVEVMNNAMMAARPHQFIEAQQDRRSETAVDNYDVRRPRKVHVYCNGDRFFRGKVIHLNFSRYRNFNDLLNDLTSKLPNTIHLAYGVRQIFTPVTGRKIRDISQLKDGQEYVCAGFEMFKPLNYGAGSSTESWSFARSRGAADPSAETQSSPPTFTVLNAFHPQRHLRQKPLANRKIGSVRSGIWGVSSSTESFAKPKVVTVFRNGEKPRPNVKILLNRRGVQSLDQFLKDVSEAFGPKWAGQRLRKLYSLRGREINSIGDFFREDDIFIGVGGDEPSLKEVNEILEQLYPDSPYVDLLLRKWQHAQRRRIRQNMVAKRRKEAFVDKAVVTKVEVGDDEEKVEENEDKLGRDEERSRRTGYDEEQDYAGNDVSVDARRKKGGKDEDKVDVDLVERLERSKVSERRTKALDGEETARTDRNREHHEKNVAEKELEKDDEDERETEKQKGRGKKTNREREQKRDRYRSKETERSKDVEGSVDLEQEGRSKRERDKEQDSQRLREPESHRERQKRREEEQEAERQRRADIEAEKLRAKDRERENSDQWLLELDQLDKEKEVELQKEREKEKELERKLEAQGRRKPQFRLKPLTDSSRLDSREKLDSERGHVDKSQPFSNSRHGQNGLRASKQKDELKNLVAAEPVILSGRKSEGAEKRDKDKPKTGNNESLSPKEDASLKKPDDKNTESNDFRILSSHSRKNEVVKEKFRRDEHETDDARNKNNKASKQSSEQTPSPAKLSADDNGQNSTAESPQRKKRSKQIVYKSKLERQISDAEHISGKYELGKVLGDGNFAVVKHSRSRANNQEFAMKIIDKSKLRGKESMIENEIILMKVCDHQNIVKLYEEYETKTEIYLVMELVKGGDLFDAITQSVKFSEVETSKMVFDLAQALYYLHSRAVVHRDLKPENILVHHGVGGERSLKLADFGLAMEVQDLIYTVCGTPTYVAPEILSEIGYGLEIDMWALGVITYILLCGFPPFRSAERKQTELFEFIKAGEFEFLSPYWDKNSDSSKALINRLLIVDRKKRYTAIDVLCDPFVVTFAGSRPTPDIDVITRNLRLDLDRKARRNRELFRTQMTKQKL